MAVARYYSSISQPTTLSGGITNANTSIQVAATVGFPISYPFTIAVDYGASSEELMDVTGAAGSTLTVVRAVDGTSAQSHSIGAVVRHVSSARDFSDFRTHEAATAAVHGVTGTLVGTSDAQTLANKTLTSPAISGATLSGTLAGTPTFSGGVLFTGVPEFRAASAATTVTGARVTGDANPRLAIAAGGGLTWGSGAATGDTTLSRTGAGMLGSNFEVITTRSATTNAVASSLAGSDTVARYVRFADGKQEWGAGSGARDTNLYRSAAAVLKTDGSLIVGTQLIVNGPIMSLNSSSTTDVTNTTTTSGVFNATGQPLTCSMLVPPSGKVVVHFGVRCDNSGGSNTLSDYNISGSSSGTIYSASDTNAIQWNGTTSAGPFSSARIFTGTAGESMTVSAMHRVVGGTGNFRYRYIVMQGLGN